MNHHERVNRAVLNQYVDRPPSSLYSTSIEYETRMMDYLGFTTLEEMYTDFGIDIWRNRVLPVYVGPRKNDVTEGRPWAECGSIDKVEEFPFPMSLDWDTTDMVKDMEAHQGFVQLVGTMTDGYVPGIWHMYHDMCGMENALCFLKEQPEVTKAMLRRITDYWLGYLMRIFDKGYKYIDIWQDMNDFGTQRSTIISPADFREFIKPCLKRIHDTVADFGKLRMQHSCGAIDPIIPDFIEMVDILNPIQVSADGMDITTLHSKYYGLITFFGGIDTQQFMRHATEREVREKVREMKRLFPTGYILAGSHELKDDIPLANAIAMFDENLQ